MTSPSLKLLKFPGPMDQGGRDNVAKLVRGVRAGEVRRVLCIYEDARGGIGWFRNNLSPQNAAVLCEQLKQKMVRESFE